MFLGLDDPPSANGMMWSTVKSYGLPQIEHHGWARRNCSDTTRQAWP
jgi:hypothetical protein